MTMIFTPEVDELPEFIDTSPIGVVYVLGNNSRRFEIQPGTKGIDIVLTNETGSELVGHYASVEDANAAYDLAAKEVTLADAIARLYERSWKVYILHFDQAIAHARHYTGKAIDVESRLKLHASGNGARIMEVLKERGIGFRLARTLIGGTKLERRVKEYHANRVCPQCVGPAAYGRITQ